MIRKGKTVPLQAWSGPEGSRKLRFPDFMTTAQDGGKVVSHTHRPPLLTGNTPFNFKECHPRCVGELDRWEGCQKHNSYLIQTQRPGLHNKQATVQQYRIAAQRRKETVLSAHKTHTNLGDGTTTDRHTQGRLHTCKYHFHIPPPTHTHMAPSSQYRLLTIYVPPQVRPFPLGQPLTAS